MFQSLEVLRDGALRHTTPLRELDHSDLVGLDKLGRSSYSFFV
jgi:hypothetical protein